MKASKPKSPPMSMYTVYRRPRDYPHGYAVRRFEIDASGSRPTSDVQYAATLEEIRAFIPPGLVCQQRHRLDEPQIAETWF